MYRQARHATCGNDQDPGHDQLMTPTLNSSDTLTPASLPLSLSALFAFQRAAPPSNEDVGSIAGLGWHYDRALRWMPQQSLPSVILPPSPHETKSGVFRAHPQALLSPGIYTLAACEPTSFDDRRAFARLLGHIPCRQPSGIATCHDR
ncbi:hypothetical protein CVT26_004471 [Gymnopilus dilepis]|uniref:Uncharacterized protein n=1 Tax=Gymnopilus dilepis TaxID=231916 RepID=A0A409WE06_9AGAR|nr:hypothetical protein CVT26_004471 [Gymnopilus dilepis]